MSLQRELSQIVGSPKYPIAPIATPLPADSQALKQKLIDIINKTFDDPSIKNPKEVITAVLNDPIYRLIRNHKDVQRIVVNRYLDFEQQKQLWLDEYTVNIEPSILQSYINKGAYPPPEVQFDGSLILLNLQDQKIVKMMNLNPRCGYCFEFTFTLAPHTWCIKIIKLNDDEFGMILARVADYDLMSNRTIKIKSFSIELQRMAPYQGTLVPIGEPIYIDKSEYNHSSKEYWNWMEPNYFPIKFQTFKFYQEINCLIYATSTLNRIPLIRIFNLSNHKSQQLQRVGYWQGYMVGSESHYKFYGKKSDTCFELLVAYGQMCQIFEVNLATNQNKFLRQFKCQIEDQQRTDDGSDLSHTEHRNQLSYGRRIFDCEHSTIDFSCSNPKLFPKAKLFASYGTTSLGDYWLGSYKASYERELAMSELFHLDTLARYSVDASILLAEGQTYDVANHNASYVVTHNSISYVDISENARYPAILDIEEVVKNFSLDLIRIIKSYLTEKPIVFSVIPTQSLFVPSYLFSQPFRLRILEFISTRFENPYTFGQFKQKPCALLLVRYTQRLQSLRYDDLTLDKIESLSDETIEALKQKEKEMYRYDRSELASAILQDTLSDLKKNPQSLLKIREAFKLFGAKPPVQIVSPTRTATCVPESKYTKG